MRRRYDLNPLDRVWSALSDASNALGECTLDLDIAHTMKQYDDWKAIDAAIDHATRLVIARIERDNQLAEEN